MNGHRLRTAWVLLAMGTVLASQRAKADPADRVLALPLVHPSLEPDVAAALERGLRTELAAELPDAELLPAPSLGVDALVAALGCGRLDEACLKRFARTGDARVVVTEVSGAAHADQLTIRIADADRVETYRAAVHPVDEDSGPELRYHLARALGVERAPPPAGLEPVPPLPEDVEIHLDGVPVPRSKLRDVGAGDHQLELRRPGGRTFVWSGRARPGRTSSVPVEGLDAPVEDSVTARAFEGRPSEDGPSLGWTYGLGAAAAVTLAGLVPVLGARVLEQETAVEAAGIDCREGSVDPACTEGWDRATQTNVALGAGVALAAGAALAFVLEGGLDGLFASEPAVTPLPEGGAAVSLSGRF